jgi:predicted Zn-dependent protease
MTPSINSPLHWLQRLCTALIVGLTVFQASAGGATDSSTLPDLGQDMTANVSPAEVRRIGEQAMAQIRQSLNYVDDAELNHYLNHIGQSLVAHIHGPHLKFHFFLVNDPTINAHAIPGGVVVINTGLIFATKSESELAAVLAHEISHITQRHYQRLLAERKRQAGVTLAALLASVVLAATTNSSGAAGPAFAAMANSADQQITFTRSFEQEADRMGIQLLAASGYRPIAMANFFGRLERGDRLNGAVPTFVLTHPVTSQRLEEARDYANRYPKPPRRNNQDFYLFRARAAALYGLGSGDSMKDLRALLGSGTNGEAIRYGEAVALIQQNKLDRARKEIAVLRREKPKDPRFMLVQADLDLTSGQGDKAVQLYRRAYLTNPSQHWLIQRYAAGLIATHHATTAVKILKPAEREDPEDPSLQKLLARASGDAGDLVTAHRAMAEYYVLTGDRGAAIRQLDIALRNAKGNYYSTAGIKARIKEIRSSGIAGPGSP